MNATQEKKITHIQSRRNSAERCMRRILWLLQWDDETYCWFKYLSGLRYLDEYLKGDREMVDILSRRGIYWNWWKNHWTLREESFLEDAENMTKIHVKTRRYMFKALHDPIALASEIHPNSAVMDDSYDKMFQQILNTPAI